ncbi:PASTA domain-containing protein [Catellatospora paridis]|uniref:PASTA domain-containing protein n=1 Tax=Catellatospora paridis TaxID=1617086 RepID=UPI0012D44AF4|nr:PASTA domain-containing protein [Catellatospora paridis]
MTDPWAQTAPLTPQRPRGFSPGTVAVLATATVLLAVAGLAIGWFAAGDGDPKAQTSASPTAVISPTPDASPSALPSPTPTVAPSTASPAPGGQVMPDVSTQDFREARTQVIKDLRVSVTVKFVEEPGTQYTVLRTEPAAGMPAPRGTHVRLIVVGPVFEFDMPNVVDKSCDAAKTELLAAGLQIGKYVSGREGTVRETSIPAGTKVKWDAAVDLTCSVATEPSPAAAG